MRITRRRNLIVVGAAAALAVGALTALPAVAEDPTEWVDAGADLTLDPAAGTVTYDGLVQALATKAGTTCDLATSGKDLLRFSAAIGSTVKKPGYKGGALGVQEQLTSWCNFVDAYSFKGPETLTIGLGADLKNFADRPLRAKSASLKLTVKSVWGRKAEVQATVWRSGVQVGTSSLTQGAAGCGATDGSTCTLAVPTDGSGFDTLRLTAAKGAFTIAQPATFDMLSEVDKDLTCEDPTIATGNASVTYLGSADGEVCAGSSGVTLTAGDQEVRFLKDLTDNPNAEFIVEVKWRLPAETFERTSTEPDPDGNPNPIPPTTIDFETEPATGVFTLGLCPDPLFDEGGAFVGVADPLNNTAVLDLVPNTVLANKQFACSGPSQLEFDGDDVVVSEQIYLLGDARMRK